MSDGDPQPRTQACPDKMPTATINLPSPSSSLPGATIPFPSSPTATGARGYWRQCAQKVSVSRLFQPCVQVQKYRRTRCLACRLCSGMQVRLSFSIIGSCPSRSCGALSLEGPRGHHPIAWFKGTLWLPCHSD